MATLNGTQINQTYKGLIKLNDNGVAGGSLKELTDGFGNGLGLFVNTGGALTTQGDLTVQGNIDATGANKIAFYYADQSTFPNANTYHGALAHSHADGKMYFAHAGSWIEIANSSDVTQITVDDVTIEIDNTNGLQVIDGSIDSDKIADDSVSYSKLSEEFTTGSTPTSTSGVSDLDFSASQVFTMTLTEDTAFTFSNDNVGMVKDLVLTGQFSPSFPAGSKIIAGQYDGSVSNFIQVIKTNTSEYWISISKEL